MTNWKLITGSAGFAFLLSFFIGVINGVSFGIVFLRAVVGALVFGGLAYGAALIIQKYLPELAKTMSLGAGETESTGGVDIVIEDESPYAGAQEASGQGGTGAGPEGPGQAGAVEERSGVPSGFEETGGTETEGEVEEAEEVEEVEEVEDTLEQPSGYADTGGPEEESERNGTEFVEEVEELSNTSSREETADAEEVEEVESAGADQNATIDSLPDIDTLSDSFAVTGEEGEESSGTSSSDSSIGTVDVAGEQEDPRNIAKAVQTMMKKE